MDTVKTETPPRRESPTFGQLMANAYSSASTVITPLGFSIVTVGVLTPLGVVPVVTLQKTQESFGTH